MTQAEQQAAAYKIWAEKHGKLAKKVLAKKTKQAGRAAISNVVNPQPKNRYRGNGAPGAQSLTIKSTESKPSKTTAKLLLNLKLNLLQLNLLKLNLLQLNQLTKVMVQSKLLKRKHHLNNKLQGKLK